MPAGSVVHRFHTAKYDPIFFDTSRDGRLNAPDRHVGIKSVILGKCDNAPSSNRRQNLTSLSNKIAEFTVDRLPNDGSPVELLCVDHNGTYVVPFLCRRVEDAWCNLETNEVIEADVAG